MHAQIITIVALLWNYFFCFLLLFWPYLNVFPDMLRLHLYISSSSSFTSLQCMYSSSKQFTNWCAISSTVLPRGQSSDNANPSSFYFRMHRPVFILGPCTLKLSLLLLCYGIISSGFCFSFDHPWMFFLRTDNSWISCLYSLDKYSS